jgi:flagellar biosynthesis/type III secretory pathway M-ring protein FliF/YscJ
MVVAVDKAAVNDTTKGVYARAVGLGGDVTGGLQTVASGANAVYTFTPENGYKVDRVLLNGNVLSAEKYANNTLTLSYDELSDNNMIEVSYVAESALAKDAARGITIMYPNLKIAADPTSQTIENNGGMPVWGIILIVLGVVLLAAIAVFLFLLLKHRKESVVVITKYVPTANKEDGAATEKAEKTTTKTAAKTTTKTATKRTAKTSEKSDKADK